RKRKRPAGAGRFQDPRSIPGSGRIFVLFFLFHRPLIGSGGVLGSRLGLLGLGLGRVGLALGGLGRFRGLRGLLGSALGVSQRLLVHLLGEGGRGRKGGGDQGGKQDIALAHGSRLQNRKCSK